jgi:hypothetical protein
MLKKYIILLQFFLGTWTSVLSQQLSHQVIVPLAGIASDSKVSYSQTVGETAVEIVGCMSYVFTQGFQQPALKKSNEIPPPGTGVNVYPNPVADYLTVEIFSESARTFRIDIVSITGSVALTRLKILYGQCWHKEPVYVENLFRGTYLVRITSEDGLLCRTFKIEKI